MKNNLLYFFLILLLNACTFGKKNKLQNRAFIYSENIKRVQPFFKVYNDSKTSSILYCKIKTTDFLSVYSASEKQNKIGGTSRCPVNSLRKQMEHRGFRWKT